MNLSGGDLREPSGEKRYSIISPYTGSEIATLGESSQADMDSMIQDAEAAFKEWRTVPIKERTSILLQFRSTLLKHTDELSNTIACESGKTLGEARAEIDKGVEVIEFASSLQNADRGGIMQVSRGVTCEYRREPLGVVAGITPFNFPAMVPLWMFPIAVTLGNSFILKPSEKVPSAASRLGELMMEAGYPAGVFSVLHGGRDVVERLATHSGIAAVGFVGSTPAAKSVYIKATSEGKRALCLGGAKNPIILVPDADPQIAVEGILASFTGCAGQRCMAASLLIAVGNVDHIIDALTEKAKKLVLAEQMGAIINRESCDRITAAIAKAQSEGATLRVDGRNPKTPPDFQRGSWLSPTIIDNAEVVMECAQCELFGPVLTVVRVKSLDEALQIDAANPYGNAVSVFTTSGAVARHVADRAGAGMIGVNIGVPVPREPFSFGGTRASKFGHGDITGDGGVEFWSDRKKITTKWTLQKDSNWMS